MAWPIGARVVGSLTCGGACPTLCLRGTTSSPSVGRCKLTLARKRPGFKVWLWKWYHSAFNLNLAYWACTSYTSEGARLYTSFNTWCITRVGWSSQSWLGTPTWLRPSMWILYAPMPRRTSCRSSTTNGMFECIVVLTFCWEGSYESFFL